MAASRRLRMAIFQTVSSWPIVKKCWIDEINDSEPTRLLEQHVIRDR
jgi:hypothetical protein